MTTEKKQFTLRMQDYNHDKIKYIAEKNKRSMAMEIEYVIEKYIEEYERDHGKIERASD